MKILLVEHSCPVLDRLRCLITAIPNALLVAQASSGAAARRHLADHRPALVVMDPCLRTGGGLALISQIKALQPSCIIIVLTNQVYPEYQTRCRQLGADYFFDKSKETVAFVALLTGLCHERSDVLPACKICCHGR